jgi:hypothetical protein
MDWSRITGARVSTPSPLTNFSTLFCLHGCARERQMPLQDAAGLKSFEIRFSFVSGARESDKFR